jgi:hypothetical protein
MLPVVTPEILAETAIKDGSSGGFTDRGRITGKPEVTAKWSLESATRRAWSISNGLSGAQPSQGLTRGPSGGMRRVG